MMPDSDAVKKSSEFLERFEYTFKELSSSGKGSWNSADLGFHEHKS